MKRINFTVFSVFLLSAYSSIAQNTLITLYKSSVPIRQVNVDLLHNIYVVSASNEIIKLSPEGHVIATYNKLGNVKITMVHVENPMRIAVQVNELQLIIFLDINLRERSRISIYDLVLEESDGVGISKNKELFLYNTESQTLRKLNDKGVIMFTSDPLFTSGEIKIYPKWIKDTGNNIFMISDSQFIKFDRFGTFQENLKLLNKKFLNSWSSSLFFKNTDGAVFILNEKKMEWSETPPQYNSSIFCTSDYCLSILNQTIQKSIF
jgi:hypothetical protein